MGLNFEKVFVKRKVFKDLPKLDIGIQNQTYSLLISAIYTNNKYE